MNQRRSMDVMKTSEQKKMFPSLIDQSIFKSPSFLLSRICACLQGCLRLQNSSKKFEKDKTEERIKTTERSFFSEHNPGTVQARFHGAFRVSAKNQQDNPIDAGCRAWRLRNRCDELAKARKSLELAEDVGDEVLIVTHPA